MTKKNQDSGTLDAKQRQHKYVSSINLSAMTLTMGATQDSVAKNLEI